MGILNWIGRLLADLLSLTVQVYLFIGVLWLAGRSRRVRERNATLLRQVADGLDRDEWPWPFKIRRQAAGRAVR